MRNSRQEPGGRRGAGIWQRADGTVFMFGGHGISHEGIRGDLSDLWRYDGTAWSYVGGAQGPAVLAGADEPAAAAWPAARRQMCTWTGADGSLFLFGGYGVTSDPNVKASLSDMWRYHEPLNRWEPMYMGSTVPSPRSDASCWVHKQTLYLFGGFGLDGFHNDVWAFDTLTLRWTRVAGQAGVNQPGVHGTIPENRYGAASFVENDGAHIVGGYSSSFLPLAGYMNDHWVFNMTTRVFRRVGYEEGPNWASGCRPGGVVRHSLWHDASTSMYWTFGGYGLAEYQADIATSPEAMLGYLNQMYSSEAVPDCRLSQTRLVQQEGAASTGDSTTSASAVSGGGGSTTTIVAVVVVLILVAACAVVGAILVRRHWTRQRLAAAERAQREQHSPPGSPMSPGSPTALNPTAIEMREMRAAQNASPKETKASVARMLDFNE